MLRVMMLRGSFKCYSMELIFFNDSNEREMLASDDRNFIAKKGEPFIRHFEIFCF